MSFISGRFLKRINFYNFIFVLHIRKTGGGAHLVEFHICVPYRWD